MSVGVNVYENLRNREITIKYIDGKNTKVKRLIGSTDEDNILPYFRTHNVGDSHVVLIERSKLSKTANMMIGIIAVIADEMVNNISEINTNTSKMSAIYSIMDSTELRSDIINISKCLYFNTKLDLSINCSSPILYTLVSAVLHDMFYDIVGVKTASSYKINITWFLLRYCINESAYGRGLNIIEDKILSETEAIKSHMLMMMFDYYYEPGNVPVI